MKKVFLDTNVLLDLLLAREGKELTVRLFQLEKEGKLALFTSFLSLANTAYVIRKHVGAPQVPSVLSSLLKFVQVLPQDEAQLVRATQKEGPDFEDLLQWECALSGGCDVLLTRNVKHFVFKEIPVMTPAEFLG